MELINRALIVISKIEYLKHGSSEYNKGHNNSIELFSAWIDTKEDELKELADKCRSEQESVVSLLNGIVSKNDDTCGWITYTKSLPELAEVIIPDDILITFKSQDYKYQDLKNVSCSLLLDFVKQHIELIGISGIMISKWKDIHNIIAKYD